MAIVDQRRRAYSLEDRRVELREQFLSIVKAVFESLEEVKEFLWQYLGDGLARSSHAWHTGVLATATPNGPSARVVVLRGVDSDAGFVIFHTDCRSPKWYEIQADPRVTWVFYDAAASVQLRLTGTATIVPAADAASIWRSLPDRSLRSYATLAAPGTARSDGGSALGPEWDGDVPPRAASEWAAVNFSAIRIDVSTIDFLSLRAAGHQRAAFARHTDGSWDASWLTP